MNPSGVLYGSLRKLIGRHFSSVSRRLRHPKGAERAGAYRAIVSGELLDAIRQEVMSSLDEIFRDMGGPEAGKEESGGWGAPPCPCRCCRGESPGGAFPYPGAGSGCIGADAEIDRLVAEALMHGRQTSGVLRALFGLVPLLIGR